MAEADRSVYPVFLRLEGRRVIVVGAGAVAARKITYLAESGARIRVVAPHASPDVERLAHDGAVEWIARGFQDADADDAWLIVAATSDPSVQKRVAMAAESRRTFVIAVDDVANASAYSGAVVRRPPFAIAISSSGATPALTRLIREIVDSILPADEWIEHAKTLRAKWIATGTAPADRFGDLVREFAARAK